MKGPRDDHIKWSQRKTNTIWHYLYVESQRRYKLTYLQNRNRLTDIENKLRVTKEEEGYEINEEFGIGRYKQLYVKQINNKSLLHNRELYSMSCLRMLVLSCVWLCDSLDCNPPGSSVDGILQARTLEWAAISSFRASSQPKNRTCVFCGSSTGRWILYHWTTWEAHIL